MRMRLMLLGGGSALGQALIRLGAEEDIGFLAPRPSENGWDAASLTELLDETRPDALINLAYYFDWFQAESVADSRLQTQERAVERTDDDNEAFEPHADGYKAGNNEDDQRCLAAETEPEDLR